MQLREKGCEGRERYTQKGSQMGCLGTTNVSSKGVQFENMNDQGLESINLMQVGQANVVGLKEGQPKNEGAQTILGQYANGPASQEGMTLQVTKLLNGPAIENQKNAGNFRFH